MKVFTVTTGSDDAAAGVTLREAVALAQAERGGGTVVFAEGVNLVELVDEIVIGKGQVTIDGDTNGDGILDVFIGNAATADTHHFTIRDGATVTLKDLGLYNGRSYDAANGAAGADRASFKPPAADGADGEQVAVPAGASQGAIAAAAGDLASAAVDGSNGGTGLDGQDGGAGGRGESAAGSIINSGNLTLVRTGLFLNSAVAGDGGDGGNGGVGQAGGEGGDGAVGGVKVGSGTGVGAVFVGTEGGVDSGHGGHGGDGGDGGAGGAGGRGGDAAGAILNRLGGTITMVDTTFGGRIAHGLLADQFKNSAYGGNGGQGGNGGNGAAGGAGGYGARDINTVAPEDAAFNGDILDLHYNVNGFLTDYVWAGIIETRIPGQQLTSRYYTEDAVGDGRHIETTVAGRGGSAGDGGSGGDAGFNGAGGHAATIVNYGTITGTAAFGTENFADGGEGDPSEFFDPVANAGTGAAGATAGRGGTETTEDFWTLRPISYVLGEYERWATDDPNAQGEELDGGAAYAFAVDPPDSYLGQPNAADGLDGTDGANGAAGGLGPDGRENDQMVSEGTARNFSRKDGLVYLTGVRQDPDFDQLLFNIVRVGDTAQAVTVTYEVFGVGKSGVRANDFADPALLTGSITFAAINQQAATFDSASAGLASIALDLTLGAGGEGAEGFRIVLRSDDVALGTNVYTGSLYDGDFDRLTGSRGNDRRLNGTADAEVIEAREGNDRVDGRRGNDYIFGDAGRDTITGGIGRDVLFGGQDADIFVFSGQTGLDRIGDFANGDRIDLSSYGITFDDLAIANIRGGVRIDHAGGRIVIENARAAMFDEADFLFS